MILVFIFVLSIERHIEWQRAFLLPFSLLAATLNIFGEEASDCLVRYTVVYGTSCVRVSDQDLGRRAGIFSQSSKFSQETIKNHGKYPLFCGRLLTVGFYNGDIVCFCEIGNVFLNIT
jgi:hypothetical protein